MSSAQIPNIVNNPSSTTFAPKKALVLGKFSRYEFEKHRNPHSSEEELIHSVRNHFIYANFCLFIFGFFHP